MAQPNGPTPLPIGPGPVSVPMGNGAMDVHMPQPGAPIMGTDGGMLTEQDDGGAVVDLDPTDEAAGGEAFVQVPHEDNLALHLDAQALSGIGQKIKNLVDQDLKSRENWESQLAEGIKYLGLTNEPRSKPFKGACGVFDPMILEAVVRSQATAQGELLPAGGPVKTEVIGSADDDVMMRAGRVKTFMNLYLTEMAPEYYPEYQRMLWWWALHGSAFKKVYQDKMFGRPVSPFIQAQDVIVPYNAVDIFTTPRVTHRFSATERDIKIKQARGEYVSDGPLPEPADPNNADDQIKQQIQTTTGVDPQLDINLDKTYTLYETQIDLDITDFPHQEQDESGTLVSTGISIPYRVTLDSTTGKVFAIYRNWEENDPTHARIQWFVHYEFVPGMGFYGLGYCHLLGSHARAATAIRRQAIDAATLATMPSGLRARGARITDNNITLAPLEFPEVETGGQPISNFIMPLPFRPPDETMVKLLQETYGAAKNLASTTEVAVGEGRQDAPVGTTIALIEAATRVETAIIKRAHGAMKREIRMIAALFGKYLAPEETYPYQVAGGQGIRIKDDFLSGHVDVIPVTDPNIASATQRMIRAQSLLTLAMQAPQIHDLRAAFLQLYVELGISDDKIAKLMPAPQAAQPFDPLTENQMALMQKPIVAAEFQDHDAHIASHTPLSTIPAIAAHIAEHMGLKMRVQIQMATGVTLPPMGAQLPPQVQNQVAIVVAHGMAAIQAQAQQAAAGAAGQPGGGAGPVMTELQLQAMDVVRKYSESQAKAAADVFKAQMTSQDKALDRQNKLAIATLKVSGQETIHGIMPGTVG